MGYAVVILVPTRRVNAVKLREKYSGQHHRNVGRGEPANPDLRNCQLDGIDAPCGNVKRVWNSLYIRTQSAGRKNSTA